MKKLVFFLLIPVFLFCQFSGTNKTVTGSQNNPLTQDYNSGSISVMDVDFYYLNLGRDFKAGYQDITVSTNDTIAIIFTLPSGASREAHWSLVAQSTGAATIQIFENATVSDSGTAITRWNRKRSSTDISSVLAWHTPTVSTTGAKFSERWIGGAGFKTDISGNHNSSSEIILKPGYIYLVYGIGNADNIKLAIGGNWYELDD